MGSRKTVKPLEPLEVERMRLACRLAARTLDYISSYIKPGISTEEIDRLVHEYTLDHQATPAPLGYKGFPKSVCTSLNTVVCHGVPRSDEILKEGDIINVDVTCIKDGFYGDTSRTFLVGEVSAPNRELVKAAYEAMLIGIDEVKPGATTGDIGFAIDRFVTRKGYSTVKEIGGHGIGRNFHEEPFVPSFGKKGRGEVLVPWQCITVEPMVNAGSEDIIEKDIPGSAIKYYLTTDGLNSAQFEHTVLVTDTGYEILTIDSDSVINKDTSAQRFK